MTWIRFDDTWAEDPVVEDLSDAAVALFVAVLCYCGRHLTDGRIAMRKAQTLRRVDDVDQVLAELIAAGLLIDLGEGHLEVSEWNERHLRPREIVLRDRARKAANQQAYRDREKRVTGHVAGNAPGQSPRPAPPRPEGKRGGQHAQAGTPCEHETPGGSRYCGLCRAAIKVRAS